MTNKRIPLKEELKLVKWIKDKLKKGIDKIKAINTRAGGFYTFEYESKWYDIFDVNGQRKLEYYDAQPIILLLGKNGKYSLGLNFHYLPPDVRKRVFDRLKVRYKEQWKSNKILPNLQWNNIKKEVSYADFMVHLYINNNIGKISRVKNTELDKVIHLPSEKFIGISSSEVWKKLGLK